MMAFDIVSGCTIESAPSKQCRERPAAMLQDDLQLAADACLHARVTGRKGAESMTGWGPRPAGTPYPLRIPLLLVDRRPFGSLSSPQKGLIELGCVR